MTKLKPRIKCPTCGKEWLWIEQYTYTATSLDIEAIPECKRQNKMIKYWAEWYDMYPKKGSDREDSKRAFKSNIKTEKDFEKLMKGTELYINQCAAEGIEKKFRKGAATFIRKKAYISLIKNAEDLAKKKLDNGNNVLYTNDGDEMVVYTCGKCGKKPIVPIVIEGVNYCQECSLKF